MVGSGAGFGNKFNFQLSRVRGHKFRKLGNCLAECLVMKPWYPVNFEKKKHFPTLPSNQGGSQRTYLISEKFSIFMCKGWKGWKGWKVERLKRLKGWKGWKGWKVEMVERWKGCLVFEIEIPESMRRPEEEGWKWVYSSSHQEMSALACPNIGNT